MLDLAGDILERSGVRGDDHVLMRENIASMLANLSPDCRQNFELFRQPPRDITLRLLGAIAYGEAGLTPQRQQDLRMLQKLRRDLDKPYDDRQVLQRLDALDQQFAAAMVDFHSRHGSFPHQVCLVGGAVRGRFGNNSDADFILNAEPNVSTPAPTHELHIQRWAAHEWPEAIAFHSPVRQVEPDDAHPLRTAYLEAMQNKGFNIDGLQVFPNSRYPHQAES